MGIMRILYHRLCTSVNRGRNILNVIQSAKWQTRDDLWKDYLATGFMGVVSNRSHHDMFAHLMYQLRKRYGNTLDKCAKSYFLELGFSAAEIEAFRERMLEP